MRKVVRLEDLIEELAELEDLREPWKVKHKMGDVIAISLFATLARCDDLKEVYYWADANEEVLRNYLELPNGMLDLQLVLFSKGLTKEIQKHDRNFVTKNIPLINPKTSTVHLYYLPILRVVDCTYTSKQGLSSVNDTALDAALVEGQSFIPPLQVGVL